MLVRDVMTSPAITTTTSTPLVEAAQLMLSRRISGLPVVDGQNRVVGTLSEADLLSRVELGSETHHSWVASLFLSGRTLAKEFVRESGLAVSDVMSPSAITVLADEQLTKAVALMKAYNVNRLFVQQGQSIVGVISRSDIVRALLEHLVVQFDEKTDAELRSYVLVELSTSPHSRQYALAADVTGGVVTISGTIFNEDHRKAIVVTIERLPGVKGVIDALTWTDPYSGFSDPADSSVSEAR